MPKQLTPQSPIASVPGLSAPSKAALAAAGYSILAHLDELNFADIVPLLHPPAAPSAPSPAKRERLLAKERRAIFEATIKSGISVRFSQDAPVTTLPTLSAAAAGKLGGVGISRFQDFAGRYFPDLYALVGFGAGKHLLLGAVLADVAVRFDAPDWGPDEWRAFVEDAVARGLLSWEDVAVTVCGEMNPPQVGTAVANAVKHRYPKGQTMQNVWRWLYSRDGRCAVSGKRLFLEADHIIPKERFIKEGRDVKDADTLENFQLLSKRENVIKRGSHKLGGLSFAPAAAVLPYILLRFRPKTYGEFVRLCRRHGLTMADVRFQEGWAFAAWLARVGEYEIEGEVAPFIKDAADDELEEGAAESLDAAEDELLSGGGDSE